MDTYDLIIVGVVLLLIFSALLFVVWFTISLYYEKKH